MDELAFLNLDKDLEDEFKLYFANVNLSQPDRIKLIRLIEKIRT